MKKMGVSIFGIYVDKYKVVRRINFSDRERRENCGGAAAEIDPARKNSR